MQNNVSVCARCACTSTKVTLPPFFMRRQRNHLVSKPDEFHDVDVVSVAVNFCFVFVTQKYTSTSRLYMVFIL